MSRHGGSVVVVGGGIAGTSAAIELADDGWQVILLEARPRLGGAVYSFTRHGMTVDTGQHVLLRAYTGYRRLLERMGVAHLVTQQDRLDIPVLRPGKPTVHLRRAAHAPAPFHLLPTLLRYSPLSAAQRIRVGRAVVALRRVDYDDERRDLETFGAWLRRHGQGDEEIAALWAMVCVAALNIGVDEASLGLAARVFRTGLLDVADNGDLAIPEAPLSELHDVAARRLLDRLGVRYRLGEKVVAIEAGSGLLLRTATGELEADAVVVAVPHRNAATLVPQVAAPDRDEWARLGSAPIVNVHLRYERPVTTLRFAAVLDSPVPWFFDRTHAAGCDGQYLVVSLSGADADLRRPAEELIRVHRDALAALFPAARSTPVAESFVTREPHATFRQQAGTLSLRPLTGTRLQGVVLAGAWTRTGWPDTMEGAVHSGVVAARALRVPEQARRVEAAT